jgi:hypothetical protein
MASSQEITMPAFPLRHPKLWAVLFAVSVLTTLYNGKYQALLGHWLPLLGLLVLMSFITPVNKLKSLNPFYKTLIGIFGVALIINGVFELTGRHAALVAFLHSAFLSAKGYFS